MPPATKLREAIKAAIYPLAEQRGFVRAKSRNRYFTTFRRQAGAVMQVFDVQWDKYDAPRFVLNFGECPMSGLQMNDIGHVVAEEVEAGWCRPGGRLQRRKGPAGWFRLRKPLFEAITTLEWRYSPDQVATQVVSTFPEVEEWFAHKNVGPHLEMLP